MKRSSILSVAVLAGALGLGACGGESNAGGGSDTGFGSPDATEGLEGETGVGAGLETGTATTPGVGAAGETGMPGAAGTGAALDTVREGGL